MQKITKFLTNVRYHENDKEDNTEEIVEPREEAVGDAFGNRIRRLTHEFEVERRTALDTDANQYETCEEKAWNVMYVI